MCEWILNYLSWLTNLKWKSSTPVQKLRIVSKVSQEEKLYFQNLKTAFGNFGSFYHLMTNKSPWFLINPVVFSTVCMTDNSQKKKKINFKHTKLKIEFWRRSFLYGSHQITEKTVFAACCSPGLVLWATFPRATLVLFAIHLSSDHF